MNGQPDWVQAPDGSWHQRVQQAPPVQVKQDSGCLKALGILFVVGVTLLGGQASSKFTPVTSPTTRVR
jgi:hypothetical protein